MESHQSRCGDVGEFGVSEAAVGCGGFPCASAAAAASAFVVVVAKAAAAVAVAVAEGQRSQ